VSGPCRVRVVEFSFYPLCSSGVPRTNSGSATLSAYRRLLACAYPLWLCNTPRVGSCACRSKPEQAILKSAPSLSRDILYWHLFCPGCDVMSTGVRGTHSEQRHLVAGEAENREIVNCVTVKIFNWTVCLGKVGYLRKYISLFCSDSFKMCL